MNDPSVSFIITNLNRAAALKETLPHLAAAFGQEVFDRDLEVVITDAGSDDGSLEVLDRFGRDHPNLRLVHQGGSRGLGRQVALENCRGKYVAVLDSDSWVSDCYASFVRGFLSSPSRDREAIVAYEDMDGLRANLTCFFAKRSILEAVGGWRDMWSGEDIDLWVRLIRQDQLAFAPIVLAQDVDFVHSRDTPPFSRTQREQKYAHGVAYLIRWIRLTKGRFIAYAYTLQEKLRDDFKNQPRLGNRALDLVGSTLARTAFYLNHPEVYRLTPVHHNGIELHRHLCSHLRRPSSFGLDDSLAELRVDRVIRELLSAGELPSDFVQEYQRLETQGRILVTGV